MNILICNDDGYLAQGIRTLARVTAEFANVRVVAPERDRSAVSNSLTLDRPLSIRQADNGFYFVDGTPTDCVHLGLYAMPEFVPDMVFSGINHGANMGDDTLYSGTVAAATEAYLLGIPAVAFSLNDKSNRYFNTAEKVAWQVAKYFSEHPPLAPILWNINIPRVEPHELKGFKVARLGRRHHMQCIVPAENPRGKPVYWIGLPGEAQDCDTGTDFADTAEGYVTVTPLSLDLTAYNQMGEVAQAIQTWSV